MTRCSKCESLRGRLSANPPHAGLVHLRTERVGNGHTGIGYIETYRCASCRSLLWRDLDPVDEGATWEVDAVGR